ncbi:hypothetical protein HGG78_11475 [Vibrio aestuarianus]|uniref:hypothetical protein n=1 Tax=Vibrio aestuarianus TaxID=28171 RepID=UPI001558ABE9|nr:hypothetical protein [Vibrio aestuarianus]MDE1340652.1 hypothetical protein [Vibrio aestuarianus]NGZ14350.1 hypothetical protein [Vibrio aestuarianus]NKZ50498.1 hypothetical protein [Vibrio aestuarianus]
MSVLPKHTDKNSHYDPNEDFTQDQMHRFTKVANQAQKKREILENRDEKDLSIIDAAKRVALRPVVKPRKDKPNTVRYAVWMSLLCVLGLWLMYMTR